MAIGNKYPIVMQNDHVADKPTQDLIKADTTAILKEVKGLKPKRYGYRMRNSEANSHTRVEYLYDAVGMQPARMVYAENRFDFGDWGGIWFNRDNQPCMVRPDGSVAYWLDPNDYSKNASTGEPSDVANVEGNLNAMSAIPLCWVKRWQEGEYRYVVFCEEQYDETYEAFAHKRPDGSYSPFAFGPMFKGFMDPGGKLRSISGVQPYSGKAAQAELDAAALNGANWGIMTWAFWNLLHDLLVLMSKSTALQEVYGEGRSAGGSSAADFLTMGTLNNKGPFYGFSDTTHPVKVFHMENFWAERYDRLVGLIVDHGVYKARMWPDGGYNLTGEGYDTVGRGIFGASPAGGYVTACRETPQGLIPEKLGGSSATYDQDYHYFANKTVSVPFVGGSCIDGSGCGRYLRVDNTAGDAGWRIGASLFLNNPS